MSALSDRVEKHAVRLDKAADMMDQDGIGGHPSRGHAMMLRKMAGSMRADAAMGKTPHVFLDGDNYMHAAAAAVDPDSADRTTAKGARQQITIDEAISAARNERDLRRINLVVHDARRLGIDLPVDSYISVFSIDQQTKGKDIQARMALKTGLRALCLIA
jgi:hypothetical protein